MREGPSDLLFLKIIMTHFHNWVADPFQVYQLELKNGLITKTSVPSEPVVFFHWDKLQKIKRHMESGGGGGEESKHGLNLKERL